VGESRGRSATDDQPAVTRVIPAGLDLAVGELPSRAEVGSYQRQRPCDLPPFLSPSHMPRRPPIGGLINSPKGDAKNRFRSRGKFGCSRLLACAGIPHWGLRMVGRRPITPPNTRKCNNQSAHQSLLNRRLDGSVSCNARSFHPALPDLMTGTADVRSMSLTTNIRVHARQLAFEPNLQILR
jgi:hypothetical protein